MRKQNNLGKYRRTAVGFHRRVARPYQRKLRRTFYRRKLRPQARANRYLKHASRMRGNVGTQLLGTLAPYQRSYHGNIRSLVTIKTVIEPYVTGGLERNFTDWIAFPTQSSAYTLFPPDVGLSSSVKRDIASLSAQKYWRIKGVKCWLRNIEINCGLSTTNTATSTSDADWIKPNCDMFCRGTCHSQSAAPYWTPGEFDTAKRYKVINGKVRGAIPISFRKVRCATICQPKSIPIIESLRAGSLSWQTSWNIINSLEQGTKFNDVITTALPGTSAVVTASGVVRYVPQISFALNGLPNIVDMFQAGAINNIYLKTVFTAEFITEVIIDAWGDFTEINPNRTTYNLRTVVDLDGNPFGEPSVTTLGEPSTENGSKDNGSEVAPSVVLPGSTSDPFLTLTSHTDKKIREKTAPVDKEMKKRGKHDYRFYFESESGSESSDNDSEMGSEEEEHWWSDPELVEALAAGSTPLDLSTGEPVLSPEVSGCSSDAM